jgi:hypothetical protein
MKQPDAFAHTPDPEYIRSLFKQFSELGRSRISVCAQLGVPYRTMSDYLNPKCRTGIDYCTQYALEALLEWELMIYREGVRGRPRAIGGLHLVK